MPNKVRGQIRLIVFSALELEKTKSHFDFLLLTFNFSLLTFYLYMNMAVDILPKKCKIAYKEV